jgi:hypothetical protein
VVQPAPHGGFARATESDQLGGNRAYCILAPERFAEGDWIIPCGGRRVYLLLSTPGHGLTRVASVVLSVWLALVVHAVDDAPLLPNSSQ